MSYPALTYNSLYTYGLNLILSLCKNKDSYDVSVPANYKTGYVSGNTATIARTGCIPDGNPSYNVGIYGKYTITNALPVVTTVNIASGYNAFMTTNGIVGRFATQVNTKGIINFCNLLASFFSVRCVCVTASTGTGVSGGTNEIFMYNNGSVTYPTVASNTDDVYDFISQTDFTTFQNAVSTALSKVTKAYQIKYSFATTSCSSSSSAFIAYFNID